jgi:polysaccharide pyruvyl transferase WcaK-like protein
MSGLGRSPSGTARRLLARGARLWSGDGTAGDPFVLPASTPGSLGDAAMLAGLRRLLGPVTSARLRYLGYRDAREWWPEAGGQPGGRLPTSLRRYGRFALGAGALRGLYLNGADVLDGKYSLDGTLKRLRLAQFVAELGRPVTITGFSVREDTPPEVVEAFRALPQHVRVCARDPRSFRRLQGWLGPRVLQAADLAFLMAPAVTQPHEQAVVDRLDAERARGRRLVGLCLNLHAFERAGASEAQRVEAAVACLSTAWQRLAEDHPDCVPVILPHDTRGPHNDLVLGQAFARAAGLDDASAVLVDRPCAAEALKAFCARLDVLITGRMHCGIAALGGGVPCVFFDYQGKVDGLLDLFGASAKVEAGPDTVACADQVRRQAAALLAQGEAAKSAVRRALQNVQRLATLNLDPRDADAAGPAVEST